MQPLVKMQLDILLDGFLPTITALYTCVLNPTPFDDLRCALFSLVGSKPAGLRPRLPILPPPLNWKPHTAV